MTTIRCRLFGHKAPRYGYYLSQPYYRRGNRRVTDNIGRIHQNIVADCVRCGETFDVCRIHDYPNPADYLPAENVTQVR